MLTIPMVIVLATALLGPATANAFDADAPLDNPEQAALYERLTDEVRCLVCQNQTIGDSSAPLAADLRREIREQVAAGRSETEIKNFLSDRYGDFVLYRPRYSGRTAILWIAPGLLLVGGCYVLWRIIRRRTSLPVPSEEDDALTAAETPE
jgi:cytochrome c-type biogenesis protein CcmH